MGFQQLSPGGHSGTWIHSHRSRGTIFLLILSLITGLQCRRSDRIQVESLYGKWDISRAERNGQETPYLRGGYITIREDGKMAVNITGSEETGPYVYQDQVIRMDQQKDFIILAATPDSMVIQYKAGPQSEFMFYMNRHEKETQ